MGVFRRMFQRDSSLSRTNYKQSAFDECTSDDLDKRPKRSSSQYAGHGVLGFVSPTSGPRRLEGADQNGHLRRLLALSTLHIQGQCANPCDGSLASIYSGSLLENDEDKFVPEKICKDDGVEKIEPWVETLPVPPQHVPNDSLTDPTSFCSVFEMLSLGPFCGSSDEAKLQDGHDDVTPLPDPDATEGGNCLPQGIPQEICFAHQDSSRREGLPEELSISRPRNVPKPSLMRTLRNLKSLGRSCPSPNAVQKVNLYIEQPTPFEHTQSIENSTITWPNEYRGHAQ